MYIDNEMKWKSHKSVSPQAIIILCLKRNVGISSRAIYYPTLNNLSYYTIGLMFLSQINYCCSIYSNVCIALTSMSNPQCSMVIIAP